MVAVSFPDRGSFTAEQVADRWGTNADYVQHLVFCRRLPQAYLISGLAKILLRNGGGRYELHPDTGDHPAQTRILVATNHSVRDLTIWPLTYVRRVYEFLPDGQTNSNELERRCEEARARRLDWRIEFRSFEVSVTGEDTCLIAFDDLLEFELANGIELKAEADQTRAYQARDARRHRSRALAQLLWERDRSATLPDVYQHEWIQRIACEGKPPTEKTFREWVKDLNPDRSPGRRSGR